MAEFEGVIGSLEELAELYRSPGDLVRAKVRTDLDSGSQRFIAMSPFMLLATSGAGGQVDVSPRGGDPGFVATIERDGRSYLAIPDLNGNNLLDSIRNVVDHGQAGTLFMLPGFDETLRVNGQAWIVTDAAILDAFTEYRRPKVAVIVRADEVYVHCAKAFRRSSLWKPETWAQYSDGPDLVDIICTQGLAQPEHAELWRSELANGYTADLIQDRA